MWLMFGTEAFNLSEYHKIFVNDATAQVLVEIRAGGAQEGNGRQILQCDDVEEAKIIYQAVMAALQAGTPVFDLQAYLQDSESGEASPVERSDELRVAWNLISNAWRGDWGDAPEDWRDRAEVFRDWYFGINNDA